MSNLSEKKRLASKELNELKTSYDTMEYRYAINEISKVLPAGSIALI